MAMTRDQINEKLDAISEPALTDAEWAEVRPSHQKEDLAAVLTARGLFAEVIAGILAEFGDDINPDDLKRKSNIFIGAVLDV
jgi:hypothetical protein